MEERMPGLSVSSIILTSSNFSAKLKKIRLKSHLLLSTFSCLPLCKLRKTFQSTKTYSFVELYAAVSDSISILQLVLIRFLYLFFLSILLDLYSNFQQFSLTILRLHNLNLLVPNICLILLL